jgi:hypothetical protein
MGMLTNVMERSREVGKTVDVVQHILAIAERERRKRALKKAPDQPPGNNQGCASVENVTVAGIDRLEPAGL